MFGFPLLLIPLAIFNIVVFLMPGVTFTAPAFTVALMSGAEWTVTFGDILITASIALLLCEIVKAVRASGRYLTDHLLSLLVFAAATAEFVLLAPFGTSVFFLLCALAFVDVCAGLALHRRRLRPARPVTAPPVETAVAPPPPPSPPPPTPPSAAPAEARIEPMPPPSPAPAVSPSATVPPATAPSGAAPTGPAGSQPPTPEPASLQSLVPGVAATPAPDEPSSPDRPTNGTSPKQP